MTGGSDRSIKVWDISKGHAVLTFPCPATVTDLDVLPHGEIVVSAHQDGSVRFWDMRKGTVLCEMEDVHRVPISSLSLSPDGTRALTCANDNTFHLIDTSSFEDVMTVRHGGFANRNRARATFSPDGAYWAAGSSKTGSVIVWSAQTFEEENALLFHQQSATIVCAWSACGLMVSGGKEGTVAVWE